MPEMSRLFSLSVNGHLRRESPLVCDSAIRAAILFSSTWKPSMQSFIETEDTDGNRGLTIVHSSDSSNSHIVHISWRSSRERFGASCTAWKYCHILHTIFLAASL